MKIKMRRSEKKVWEILKSKIPYQFYNSGEWSVSYENLSKEETILPIINEQNYFLKLTVAQPEELFHLFFVLSLNNLKEKRDLEREILERIEKVLEGLNAFNFHWKSYVDVIDKKLPEHKEGPELKVITLECSIPDKVLNI